MAHDPDRVTARLLDHAVRAENLEPAALQFLLRRYRAHGGEEFADAVGRALAVALDDANDPLPTLARAEWLSVFADALAVSDDARLAEACRRHIEALAAEWPETTRVAAGAASVDACVSASHLVDPHALIPRAIDELERIVAGAYRPGRGMASTTKSEAAEVRGALEDQVRTASALITAYEYTGRLPYSMLAEELIQLSKLELASSAPIRDACRAARVMCRLAALHEDASYRAGAVVAPDSDYRADAGRLLDHVEANLGDGIADVAAFGLALDEWSA